MTDVTRLAALILVSAGLTLLIGCELGGPEDLNTLIDDEAGSAVVKKGLPCTGAKPLACLAGCGSMPLDAEPTCREGRWSCAVGIPETRCPDYLGKCSPDEACGHGYTCVKTLNHPVPAEAGICSKGELLRDYSLESCDDAGTTPSGELVDNRAVLTGTVVKFAGRVGVTMKCSNAACSTNAPCCKHCVANYMVELSDPIRPEATLTILVRTETVPCVGSNCGMSCTPLVVGDTYKLWGLLADCQGQSQCTLLYMGSCPL